MNQTLMDLAEEARSTPVDDYEYDEQDLRDELAIEFADCPGDRDGDDCCPECGGRDGEHELGCPEDPRTVVVTDFEVMEIES